MSGIFQGLAAADGKIPAIIVSGLPPDAVSRNGLLVSPNGELYVVPDTNQPRVFKYGIAFERATGLLILGNEAALPYSIPMGGMLADSKGAFLGTPDDPDVIHQAVGLKIVQNAGVVCGTGLIPLIVNQLDGSQDNVVYVGQSDVVFLTIAVDGNTYSVPGGSGVTHGTVKSPTNLDAYSFDGTVNSYLVKSSPNVVPQAFTVFAVLKKGATGVRTVFDNL